MWRLHRIITIRSIIAHKSSRVGPIQKRERLSIYRVVMCPVKWFSRWHLIGPPNQVDEIGVTTSRIKPTCDLIFVFRSRGLVSHKKIEKSTLKRYRTCVTPPLEIMNSHRFVTLLLLSIAIFVVSALGIKENHDIHRILRTGGNKAKCSANVACAAKKLTGDCCPTTSGATLDCCNVKSAKCSANTACKNLGLQGACCPTKDGVLLDCCQA